MNFFTVTELTKYIKDIIQDDLTLNDIWIKGEVSNLKEYKMGKQIYFTLKDANSQISCVIFQTYLINFNLEENMEIIARGKISIYEKRGTYSLHINYIEPSGVGTLALAFEQLKKKLQSEGLFDENYKNPIPKFPQKVAILSSPSGAAIHDVVSTIRNRNKSINIIIVPTIVQGDKAKQSIAENIKLVDQKSLADVIIVCRGGGSIEELWAFNEELVARAIFKSKTPIISAVGHEIDFTISDFVADARASTPTAAGVLVTVSQNEYLEKLKNSKEILQNILYNKLKEKKMMLADLNFNLEISINNIVRVKKQKLEILLTKLQSNNPGKYAKKGLALIDKNDIIITSANELIEGDEITITFINGKRKAIII
jgi:exodeoxyribonuclease VII large subunit